MSMNTNHGNDFNKNTTDRNMNDKSVTAFLLSPRYRIYRHLLLQLVVVLITINVLWYEPLQTVSFGRRLGGCLAYFASMNMVIYINLYVWSRGLGDVYKRQIYKPVCIGSLFPVEESLG